MSARGNAKSGAKNYGSKDRKAEGKAIRAAYKRLTLLKERTLKDALSLALECYDREARGQAEWDRGIAAGKRLQAGIRERGARK